MLHFDQLEGRAVLTEREHQILELVAVGLSAKEVAQKISIAPRTVERHIENIRLKMRARNRTHMVTCAAMSGLLTAHVRQEPITLGDEAQPALQVQQTDTSFLTLVAA